MIITKEGFAVLENDTHLSRWIEESGRIDHNEKVDETVCNYFNEGDHVIDIGASLGDHTVPYARKVGRAGKVHAFEPQPESFECLKHNVRHYSQVTIHNVALGMESSAKLLDRCGNIGASRIVEEADMTSLVKVETLDSFPFSRVDFIKIDTEGYDLFVMKGGIETIKKHRPLILFELSGCSWKHYGVRTNDFNEFLEEINYKPDIPIDLKDGIMVDTLLTPQ